MEYLRRPERRQGTPGTFLLEASDEREEREAMLNNGLFAVPANSHPATFVKAHFGPGSKMEFVRGTTTLAFVYEGAGPDDVGGVVVAADSRASTGTYTASKTVTKILDIAPHLVATMAGGAADCQYWCRWLGKETELYELRTRQPQTVAAASKQLANLLWSFKGMGISMGSMVAGVDKSGPKIYFVDQDGLRMEGKLFSVGSGSLNATSILDTFYKPIMSDAAAVELATRAIVHATYRDAGSGGLVNVCHISTKKGKNYIWHRDVSDLAEEFLKAPPKHLTANPTPAVTLVPDKVNH